MADIQTKYDWNLLTVHDTQFWDTDIQNRLKKLGDTGFKLHSICSPDEGFVAMVFERATVVQNDWDDHPDIDSLVDAHREEL